MHLGLPRVRAHVLPGVRKKMRKVALLANANVFGLWSSRTDIMLKKDPRIVLFFGEFCKVVLPENAVKISSSAVSCVSRVTITCFAALQKSVATGAFGTAEHSLFGETRRHARMRAHAFTRVYGLD